MIFLLSHREQLSGSRVDFLENALKSRFITYLNEQLGQNLVKISKRINLIIVSSGFTRKYKKIRP